MPMKMSRTLFDRMVLLFATDVNFLMDPVANHVGLHPIMQPFNYRPDLVASELTLSDGVHMDRVRYQQAEGIALYYDPVSGSYDVIARGLIPPWHFITSGTFSPFVVYGFAYLAQNDAVLIGVQQFYPTKRFTAAGQYWDDASVKFSFPPTMVS